MGFESRMRVAVRSLDVNVERLIFVAETDVLQDLLDAAVAVVATVVVFEPLGVVGERLAVVGLRKVAIFPVDGDLGVVEVGGAGFRGVLVRLVARFVELFCKWVKPVFAIRHLSRFLGFNGERLDLSRGGERIVCLSQTNLKTCKLQMAQDRNSSNERFEALHDRNRRWWKSYSVQA